MRKISFCRAILLALGLFLSVGFACAGEAAIATPAALFPAETVFYMGIENPGRAQQLWPETALGKIFAEPEVQAFLLEAKEKWAQGSAFANELLQHQAPDGLKVEDLLALLDRRAAAGVAYMPEKRKPVFLVTAELANEEKAKAFLVKLSAWIKAVAPPQLAGGLTFDLEGTSVLATGPRDPVIALRRHGAWICLTLSEKKEEATELLDHLGAGPGMAGNASFTASVKALGEDRESLFFLDGAACVRLLKETAGKERNLTQALPVLESLGLLDLQGMAGSVESAPPGFRQRLFLHLPAPRRGLWAHVASEPVSPELLRAVPEDAASFSALRFDLSGLAQLLRDALTASGAPPEMLEMVYASAQAQLGFHPETDLLKNLGSEAAFVMLDPDQVGGIPLFGLNGIALVFQVKDEAAVASALETLFSLAAAAASGSEVGGGPLRELHGDRPIQGFRFGNFVAPSFALRNGYLILGTGPQSVAYLLDTLEGKRPALLGSAEYTAAIQRLGETGGSFASFQRRPQLSFQSGGMGMSSVPILAGMLLPALNRARGQADLTRSINNLKQIGTGMALYDLDHNGATPATLADLYDNGNGVIGDPLVFQCPVTEEGYCYIGGEAAKAAKPNHIIAWNAYPSDDNRQVALFRDGHCQVLHAQELDEQLAEFAEYLQGKGIAFDPQPPYVPGETVVPAGPAGQRPRASGNALAFRPPLLAAPPFSDWERHPERIVKELLDTFRLYKLPSARCIGQHLFASAGSGRVTEEGLLFVSHAPLPFGNLPDGSGSAALTGSVPMIAIIAAIAIPNLLESKKAANETQAIASLKAYATAQEAYRANNYAATNQLPPKSYAPSIRFLGGAAAHRDAAGNPLTLLPSPLAEAQGAERSYNGYYYIDITHDSAGAPADHKHWHGLAAVPAEYGTTGSNVYIIDVSGTVYMSDFGRQPAREDLAQWPSAEELEAEWFNP